MKISTKGRYGTRAALELALHYGSGPIMVREIGEHQNISERYLEQILNTLRTADLVKSTRGARGGYELARDPSTITVGDVVRALEGPFDIVPCTGEEDCPRMKSCITGDIWQEIKEAIEGVVNTTTLTDLVERYRMKSNQQQMEYYI